MRVRLEVQLASAPIGYVGVQLRRRKIGMTQHLLHRTEVGASLEQVRRERMAQQVRVDPFRLERRGGREPAEDQEDAGAGERAAAGVQEELRAVTRVQKRAAAREVAPQRLDTRTTDRDYAFLVALADRTDEAGRGADVARGER